ncbi:MAG: antitoxin Xre/MbcA/ParS toxin-binding domain-containing protein [Planctomycetaceae bacterium]
MSTSDGWQANKENGLLDALAEFVREESLGKWLQTPNEAFGGLKPIEVIDRGEIDRIGEMVYFLRSGVGG